ncbi:MAG: ABC transporter permease [Bacteroidota bacterium]
MLKTHLRIILRNINRRLSYSLINILGLAVGIASSFVILLYVTIEKSYEKDFSASGNTYRIATKFMSMGTFANGPEVLLNRFPEQYDFVDKYTRVDYFDETVVSTDYNKTEASGLLIDSSFFSIFDFKFLVGNSQNAARNSHSIVLSEDFSEQLFGGRPVLGEQVLLGDNKVPVTVTGVIAETTRTHLRSKYWVTSVPDFSEEEEDNLANLNNWYSIAFWNYLTVKPGTATLDVQQALDTLVKKETFEQANSPMTFTEHLERDDSYRLLAQPLEDIHLKGTLSFDLSKGGNESVVDSLLVIGALILLMATINFVNLTTARSTERMKEVGLKKVMGSQRITLMSQFMMESLITCWIAMAVALGLSELFLFAFIFITGQEFISTVFIGYQHILNLFWIASAIGLVAGVYPCLHMSAFKPIQALKGGSSSGKSKAHFRNVLSVIQFTFSICLIIGSVVVFNQIRFMNSKDLGFDNKNILIIDGISDLGNQAESYKEMLSSRSEAVSASLVSRMPGSTSSFSMGTIRVSESDEPLRVTRFQGDFDYLETLGYRITRGRDFSIDLASDSSALIINETAVRILGLQDPIGARLVNGHEIVGVVSDFNFESLKETVAPAMLQVGQGGWYQLAIKLNPENVQDFLAFAGAEWSNLNREEPFTYHFLDENYERLMKEEITLGKAVLVFTILAVLIASLGLFGLSSYIALQRQKEIGVRKVLGASALAIFRRFNSSFALVLLISFIIAAPISYYFLNGWLSNFANRIQINYTVFILAGIITYTLALVVIGFHSIKLIRLNPVITLREE